MQRTARLIFNHVDTRTNEMKSDAGTQTDRGSIQEIRRLKDAYTELSLWWSSSCVRHCQLPDGKASAFDLPARDDELDIWVSPQKHPTEKTWWTTFDVCEGVRPRPR